MIVNTKSRLKIFIETLVISLSLMVVIVHSSLVVFGVDELSAHKHTCFDDRGALVECT